MGLGISWYFALLMSSNKKRKGGKGKKIATMLKKVDAEVKKGRFDTLVTPLSTSSLTKGRVEED